jgi:hypothetical protein
MNSRYGRKIMTRMPVALIACGLLIGCSTIDVRTDWDRAIDFSQFESFALLENSETAINRLIDGRIRAAIIEEITSKGLRQLEKVEGADLAIGFQVATENRRSYRTVSSGWRANGYRHRRGGPGWHDQATTVTTRTRVREYTVGALVLAIFDGKSKELVWEGSGSQRLDSSGGPEQSEQRIHNAVQQILREFPPDPPAG